MHMLQSIGTNRRVKHLQYMPQWGSNANGVYDKHMCIMYLYGGKHNKVDNTWSLRNVK